MPNAITRLLQRRSLRRAVHQALDSGVGLYHSTWAVAPEESEVLAGNVIAWCREVLGGMHRPYGVDSVSLAIAAVGPDKRALASANFAVLRPADFYAGPVEGETRETLRRWAESRVLAESGAHLSVVLFSWGDLTQELLLAS